MKRKISVAIADDHLMLRKGVVSLLRLEYDFQLLFEADNGSQVVSELTNRKIPDVLILDINMGEGKDGFETAQWVTNHFPQIKILALSMYQDETSILKMIQAGAKGFITKNEDPLNLILAIRQVFNNEVYLPAALSKKIFQGIQDNVLVPAGASPVLTERERKFLSLLRLSFTYKEIADKMHISPQTVHDYRKNLIKKLAVKGKVGLVVYCSFCG